MMGFRLITYTLRWWQCKRMSEKMSDEKIEILRSLAVGQLLLRQLIVNDADLLLIFLNLHNRYMFRIIIYN